MSWLATSHMEVEPGEVGDELAGAPSGLCSASASHAPFPFVLRPIAASQLQLFTPGLSMSKVLDVGVAGRQLRSTLGKDRQLARPLELSSLASCRDVRRPALPFRALRSRCATVPVRRRKCSLCSYVESVLCCHGWCDAPAAAAFCGNGGIGMPSDGLPPRADFWRHDTDFL